MAEFTFKVFCCDRKFYDGPCEKLIFPGFQGDIEVLAHHETMMAAVQNGTMRYQLPGDEQWRTAAVSHGFVEMKDNVVTMIVYSCEKPEEIDVYRAQEALERARERMINKQSIEEYHMNRAAMARAMARLKTAGKYQAR